MRTYKNLSFFKRSAPKAFGGELRKKAKFRGARPLVTRTGTMHLVLRSSQAKGVHSFQHSTKRRKAEAFLQTFSAKKGVKILKFANVGNHLHLHVKLHNRRLYKEWIRGLTSGLAMISQGLEGLRRLRNRKIKFWDLRPFTRVIENFRHFLNMKDYVEINLFEGIGIPRLQAEILVKGSRHLFRGSGES